MDTKRLKFDDMMEQVERDEYQTKIPAWIRKITKTKEPTPTQYEEQNNGGGGSGEGREKTPFQRAEQRQKIEKQTCR